MTKTTALAALALLSSGLAAAACGGGGSGHGVEPCCGATGETVPPAGGFAAVSRYAQVVVLDTSSSAVCPTLAPGGIDLSQTMLAVAGDPEPVAADGTFELTIDAEAGGASTLDRLLFVRVFDKAGSSKVVRGVGPLSAPAAEGATIPVAPIFFQPGAFGESTVETVIGCRFHPGTGPDDLQNMIFSDVRAFITEDLAQGLQPGGVDSLFGTTKIYRHGVNGLFDELVSNGTPAGAFHAFRREAERIADLCKARDPSSPAECRNEADARRRARIGDAYRFWYFVRHAYDDGSIVWEIDALDPARQRLQALAEDVTIELLQLDGDTALDDADPIQAAAFRLIQLLRYEIAAAKLQNAFSCYGSPNGPPQYGEPCADGTLDPDLDVLSGGSAIVYPSLNASLAALRAALLATSATPADLRAAWSTFATDVSFNFALQVEPGSYNDQPTNGFAVAVSNALNGSIAMRNDFLLDGTSGIDWDAEAIRQRLYESSNPRTGAQGLRSAIQSEVYQLGQSLPGGAESYPTEFTDVLFYAHVNAAP